MDDYAPLTHHATLPPFTPVPRLKDRSNGWSAQVQQRFIEALADTGSVKAACRRVGRSEVGAYQLRRHPEAESFREAWEAALALGIQKIEDVAMDRALNGIEVPVYSYGKLVGTRRVYNDRLLMFMLRNRAPARFAAQGARGMSALDRDRLARLKKEWRKEWQGEQPGEAEILKSLTERLDRIRANQKALSSPRTRALREELRKSEEQDRAAGFIDYKMEPDEEEAEEERKLFGDQR